jgi:hypothetical protein
VHDDAPLHAPIQRFSRKIENHMAAVALNYFAYNSIKIHTSLRMSPAMAAGITGRLFDVSDWWRCWWTARKKLRDAAG